MPLDAICLTALLTELRGQLLGGKIDKIYQPGRDEIVMAVRAPVGNVKLLFSANPGHPRVQLTEVPRENPDMTGSRSLEAVTGLSWGRVAPVVADPSVVLPACFASCAF